MKRIIPIFALMLSCSFLGNDRLNDKDLKYLKQLGLLDKNEHVLIYTSSLSKKKSGSFITDKRIATYWIDKDERKTYKHFAFYGDIVKIDSFNFNSRLDLQFVPENYQERWFLF